MVSASTVILGAPSAYAADLIVSSNLPEAHWASVNGYVPFMQCATEESNGEIQFKFFPGGTIASLAGALDALDKGIADIALISPGALTDRLPLSTIANLPGMGESAVESATAQRAVIDGGGFVAAEHATNNFVALLINRFPSYQILSKGAPLDTAASLTGVKITSDGGPPLVVLGSIGAVGIEMPGVDVYLSLQQGVADGSLISLPSAKSYHLNEVVKAVSTNGSFGSTTGLFSIRTASWDALSDAEKKVMSDCGRKIELELAKWVDNWVVEIEGEFAASGITMYEFSEEEKAKIEPFLEDARLTYVRRLVERGLPAEGAYTEFLDAVKASGEGN